MEPVIEQPVADVQNEQQDDQLLFEPAAPATAVQEQQQVEHLLFEHPTEQPEPQTHEEPAAESSTSEYQPTPLQFVFYYCYFLIICIVQEI